VTPPNWEMTKARWERACRVVRASVCGVGAGVGIGVKTDVGVALGTNRIGEEGERVGGT
jgi:hypothetical protein